GRPVHDDYPHDGDCRLAREQEVGAGFARHLPDDGWVVRRPGRRRDRDCRRPDLLPRARPRPPGRTVRDGRGHNVLTIFPGVTAMDTSKIRKRMPVATLLDPKIVVPAIGQAFVKLNPATLIKNPVMFVLEVVTVLTTVILVRDLLTGGGNIAFEFQIVLWLWFTVLFANFAEAVAEGRGKAQGGTLRQARNETRAKGHQSAGNFKQVVSVVAGLAA